MPKIVANYRENNNLVKVISMQKELLENYKNDVIKYAAEENKPKILITLNSIPTQLSKKNKKFMYSKIDIQDSNATQKKYYSAIDWLNDAGIVNFCYNLTEPAIPLKSNLKLDTFKIYMQDIGLLVSMFEKGIQSSILNDDNLYINEGAILENVFGSEIMTRYEDLMYFERKSKLEIDFILNIDGRATAIEVKSGNNKQAKSLKSIIQNYQTVTRYMKFEKDTNVYVDNENIEHYPLFMIMFV